MVAEAEIDQREKNTSSLPRGGSFLDSGCWSGRFAAAAEDGESAEDSANGEKDPARNWYVSICA